MTKKEKFITRLSTEKYLLPSLALFSATFFLVRTSITQNENLFFLDIAATMFAVNLGIFGPLSYILFFRSVDYDKITFNTKFYKTAYTLIILGYFFFLSGIVCIILHASILSGFMALIPFIFITLGTREKK